jgi:hypothetical protein
MDIESGAAMRQGVRWSAPVVVWSLVVKLETDPCNTGAAEQLYRCSAMQGV